MYKIQLDFFFKEQYKLLRLCLVLKNLRKNMRKNLRKEKIKNKNKNKYILSQ